MVFFRTNTVFCHYCVVSKKEKETWKTSKTKKKLTSSKTCLHGKKHQSVFKHIKILHVRKLVSHTSLTSQCQDVGELMGNQQSKRKATEWKYLLEVNWYLPYFGRQGITLQDHARNNNFTQILCLLSTNDKNLLHHLEGKIGHKYMHSYI